MSYGAANPKFINQGLEKRQRHLFTERRRLGVPSRCRKARSTYHGAAARKVDALRNPRTARGPHLAWVTSGPLHLLRSGGVDRHAAQRECWGMAAIGL